MKLLFKKIVSYAIDYLLVAGLGGIYAFCANVFYLNPETQSQATLMLVCAFITVILLTCYIPTKCGGQTIGQKLMRLRVVTKAGKTALTGKVFCGNVWLKFLLRRCLFHFPSFTM